MSSPFSLSPEPQSPFEEETSVREAFRKIEGSDFIAKEQGLKEFGPILAQGRGLEHAYHFIDKAADRGIHGLIPLNQPLVPSKTENMLVKSLKEKISPVEKAISLALNDFFVLEKDSPMTIKGIVEIVKGYVLHHPQSPSRDLFKDDHKLMAADADKGIEKADGAHSDGIEQHELPDEEED